MSWLFIEFPATIEKMAVGKVNQILSAEIEQSGRFPVVDQGQAFIAGYSNAEERVVREGLPLVIFGDHTRCLKYVDFPFILGADGTKVFKPRADLFDPKFFYFALQSLDIPNRGYNRHFTILKERMVPRPEKDEQRKIAGVLGLVQRAIEQQERLIAMTTELKKTLLHKLFTEGLRGEPQKQTDIGPVPLSWEVLKIQDLVDQGIIAKPMDGNHGNIHPKSADFVKKGIPFVMASDLVDGTIDFYGCAYLRKEQADRLQKGFAYEGDVLISHKATIGVTAMVPKVENYVMLTPQVTYYRVLDKERLNNFYLKAFFNSGLFQEKFHTIARDGSTRSYIGITKQRELHIALPSLDEQLEIASCFTLVERKCTLAKKKSAALLALFRTMLHQLMSAQVRVHDLDLPKSSALVY